MTTEELVKQRGSSYGHPRQDFSRTAIMWSAILGTPVTAEQIPLCMIALKISRECHSHNPDNAEDIKGYAKTLEMLYEAVTDNSKE